LLLLLLLLEAVAGGSTSTDSGIVLMVSVILAFLIYDWKIAYNQKLDGSEKLIRR